MNGVAVKETILDRAMRCRERGESMKGVSTCGVIEDRWMQITESSTGGSSKCTRQEAGNAPHKKLGSPFGLDLGGQVARAVGDPR